MEIFTARARRMRESNVLHLSGGAGVPQQSDRNPPQPLGLVWILSPRRTRGYPVHPTYVRSGPYLSSVQVGGHSFLP